MQEVREEVGISERLNTLVSSNSIFENKVIAKWSLHYLPCFCGVRLLSEKGLCF